MSDWEDEDHVEAEKREFDRQFDKLEKNFYVAGFRQALSDDSVNDKTLQDSFDLGYEIGFDVAKKFNQLYTATRLIEGLYQDNRIPLTKAADDKSKEALLEKLKDFNLKMSRVQSQVSEMLKNAQIKPCDENPRDRIKEAFEKIVNLEALTSEASDILLELDCPVALSRLVS